VALHFHPPLPDGGREGCHAVVIIVVIAVVIIAVIAVSSLMFQ
jgi:hypothetical protein